MTKKFVILLLLYPYFLFAQDSKTSEIFEDTITALPVYSDTTQAKLKLDEINQAIASSKEKKKQVGLSTSEKEVLQEETRKLKDTKEDFIKKQGLPLFSFLGGPGYTPELGGLLALGGLYSFSTNRQDPDLQRSNIGAFLVLNKGSGDFGYALKSSFKVFFDENKQRLTGTLQGGFQSDHYWGVGYDAGISAEVGDETLMNSFYTKLKMNYVFEVLNSFFVGPAFSIQYNSGESETLGDVVSNDLSYQLYKSSPLSVGVGVALQYDSRDVAVNPWSGQYLNIEYLLYDKHLGSYNQLYTALFDYRYYYSLQKGKVFALYNSFQMSDGDVPYYLESQVGGQSSMRGIYAGQFRDDIAVEHTLEYRHTFLRSDKKLSNHGMTLWGGLASVVPEVQNVYQDLFYSYGVGYRYQIQPRMNLRLDLGFSEYGIGFYFNFTEAF